MGYGDAIVASSFAKGFHEHGLLAAFFVYSRKQRFFKCTGFEKEIFHNNPNIALPGMEGRENIIWLPHWKISDEELMGYGDEIMGTGLAKRFKESGKLAAFGDGRKILWGPWCEEIFANNPNIARPGSEQNPNLEWIAHYKGMRKYNKMVSGKWVWNYDFKVTPGEFFFDETEQRDIEYARQTLGEFIVIEPNVPWQKTVASNKDWGQQKYEHLAQLLSNKGIQVVQFIHNNSKRKLQNATRVEHKRFRDAIGTLSLAKLYIGPEGGMHHAAAAVGTTAVVLMGGFVPPSVVGYDDHINLTGGAEACGNIYPCAHCKSAMERISVGQVYDAAMSKLQ